MSNNGQTTISRQTRWTTSVLLIALGLVVTILGGWYGMTGKAAVVEDRLERHSTQVEPHLTPTELEQYFPPREVWERELEHLQQADAEQTKLLREVLKEVR